MVFNDFILAIFLVFNSTNCDTRVKRQINFPLQGNATNSDGCPARLPCYLSSVGVCVESEIGGKCPQGRYGNDSPVFEEVDTPEELKVGERFFDTTVYRWTGTTACPSCDRSSCKCLVSLDSIAYLYPDTYPDIYPDQLPLCDQESGQPWCYVHRHSECCGDNMQSTKYSHVDVSYQACTKSQLLAQGRCRKPCRCSKTLFGDDIGGLCNNKTYQGDYWCYVDPEACCQLKVQSKQHGNLYWSTEPCSGSASQVNLDDFENRVLENGNLICDTDEDCFAVAAKMECTGDRAYCSQDSVFIAEEFEDKFDGRGICLAEDHNTCRHMRDICTNPCNTSTCYSARRTFDNERAAAGAIFPLSASSLAGVSAASLTGHLVTAGGCPSPVLPCRCGRGRNRCCKPLWGGQNRGLFCPRIYPV